MKRLFPVLALTAMTLQFPVAQVFAQQTVIPVVPSNGNGRMLVGNSQTGDFKITAEETTRAMSELIARHGIVQDNDKQYLQDVASRINAAYVEYVALVTNGRLIKASQTSISGGSVLADEYFSIINEVKEKKLTLDSAMFSLTSVSAEALPSGGTIKLQNGNEQVMPSLRNINFKPLSDGYALKIEGLEKIAKNLQMKVIFPKFEGQPQIILKDSGKTLDPEFALMLFSPEEIKQMNAQVQQLRAKETPFRLMNDQSRELRRLIQAFVTNYGSNEKYRNRDDEKLAKESGKYASYMQARNDAIKKIAEIFFHRSYLRAKFGAQIGAIQPAKYEKKIANVDKWFVSVDALKTMREEIALNEIDLANAAENVRMVLKVVDERSTHILGANSSGNLLVKANSLINFIAGNRPTTEALLMVWQLIAADIKEEQLLSSGNGMEKVFEFYQSRYQSTAENKAFYAKVKCSIDTELQSDDSCRAVLGGEFSVSEANNAGGVLASLFNQLNGALGVKAVYLEQAAQIEKQIAIAKEGMASNKRALARARKL